MNTRGIKLFGFAFGCSFGFSTTSFLHSISSESGFSWSPLLPFSALLASKM
jgi:hypothetical protein